MSGRKGRPMTLYRKDAFLIEAAAKLRRDRAAWELGEYEADPKRWPCPDGPFCRLGCKELP